PINLQDHGNPVRFRNIWVLPRNAEQEAKRPIVPAFERFYASTGADPAAGGRFLLGELNCVACHQADETLARQLTSRPSPILDEVGKRIHPEYLLKYLANPHQTKPGTLMPDVLSSLAPPERDAAVLALTNLLVSTGTVPQLSTDLQAAQRGQQLFKQIGCLACHAAPDDPKTASKTAIPLGKLSEKYSISSLAAFLQDPHKTRPAGRMPNLIQENKEAIDLASYLIGNVEYKPRNPNLKFSVYHGTWNNVPKFEELKPVKQGEAAGFDLLPAGRTNEFGMRFEGFLKIEKDGDYTFHLGSDDGSLLFIDGKKVADSDGVHPHTVNSGTAKLTKGMHPIRVDYTQGGGEATLTLEYEGAGVPRQDINRVLSLTEKGPEPKSAKDEPAGFQFDPALAEKGRVLFTTVGCANCHQLKHNGQPLKSLVIAPAMKQLKPGQGCLAENGAASPAVAKATKGSAADVLDAATKSTAVAPQFDLNSNQRVALNASLTAEVPMAALSPKELIAQSMTAFNCYSCHSRGGIGGPTRDRNPLFLTTIPEMGDEGRVPPPLDGVGDKLNPQWLQHVLQNGAKDRPYMLTRMPKFGLPKVNELTAAFVSEDRREGGAAAKIAEAEHRVKAVGRQLVGDKALGCIKCHTFGPHKASGIQAINLQTMTQRVREDWFLRYMIDPVAYRPGTRMPTGFPGGKATIRDVYEGKPDQQLSAIWTFLKDGGKAGLPEGLLGNVIELKPEGKPILYRNFIDGLTPRGIAVGYPEHGNLAWDANKMCLTLIWHGRFIDAGKHWEGRGPGNQGPLGDHVMKLEDTVPLAVLESPTAEWPKQLPREAGYRFRGYDLDKEGRPHFHYASPTFSVLDFPKPVVNGKDAAFERRLTITAKDPVNYLYFRAATGKIEPQADGWYLLDGDVRIRLSGSKPILRESGGRQELLVPIVLVDGKAEILQEIQW
ncbi:MAG: petJ, partial [Planctomycetaceae bacterium]|nr:petJ [Planctomycetaceae bacterium]